MAVGHSVLTSDMTSTNGTSYTTASVDLVTGRRYILALGWSDGQGGTAAPTISGAGSWGTAIDSTESGAAGLYVYEYVAASNESGTITFDAGAVNMDQAGWIIIEMSGDDTSSKQTASDASASVTSLSISFLSAPASSSRCFAFFLVNANEAQTHDGDTELIDSGVNGPSRSFHAWYDDANGGSMQNSSTSSATRRGVIVEIPVAAAGGTPVGIPTETDTAQALTIDRGVNLGQSAESDTAQAVAHSRAMAVAQATESDSAQALTHSKTVSPGQAIETDSAQALSSSKVTAAGQAVETDSGLAITPLRAEAVGQASETDTSQAVTPNRDETVGQASETDAAQAVVASLGGDIIAVGQASETDAAQALTVLKTAAVGQASETDSALALGIAKVEAVGQATETDTVEAVTPLRVYDIGQTTESDSAQAIARLKTAALGLASETDVAFAMGGSTVITVGQASESETAQAVAAGRERSFSWEGGVDEDPVTTSDTGNGNEWDSVFTGPSGINKYDTAAGIVGFLGGYLDGGASNSAPYYRWVVDELTEEYFRVYVRAAGSLPPSNERILQVRTDSSVTRCGVRINSSGNIVLFDALNGSAGSSTKAFAADEAFRLEVHIAHHATTGHIEGRLFYGANLHGTTPDETFGNFADNYDTSGASTGVDRIELGWLASVTNQVLHVDAFKFSTLGWIGPADISLAVNVGTAAEIDSAFAVTTPAVPTGAYLWRSGRLYGGGGVNCLTCDPLGTRWVAGGDNNGPKYSTDGGATWLPGMGGLDEATIGQELQTVALKWAQNAATPDRVWRTAKYGFAVSNNGGADWDLISQTPALGHDGTRPRIVGHIIDDTGSAVYLGAQNGVIWRYRSWLSDGTGGTLSNIANLGDIVTGVRLDPNDDTILYATTRSGVYRIEGIDTGTRTVRQFTGTGVPVRAEEIAVANEGGTTVLYVAAYNTGIRRVDAPAGGSGNITTAWDNITPPMGASNQWCAIDSFREGGVTYLVVGSASPDPEGNGFGQVWYSDDGDTASPSWVCLTDNSAQRPFYNEMGGPGGDPWWGYGLRENPTPKETSPNKWVTDNGKPESVAFDSADRTKIIAAGQQGMWMFDLTTGACYPCMVGIHSAVETAITIDPNDDDNIYITNSDHIGHHTTIGGRNGDWRKNENAVPNLNGTTAFQPIAIDSGVNPGRWFAGFGDRFANASGEIYWHANPGDGSNWDALDFGVFSTNKRPLGLAVRRISGSVVVLVAVQGGGIAKRVFNTASPPSGGTWEYKNTTAFTTLGTEGRDVPLEWSSDTVAYGYDPASGLWRTTNAGESWTKIWGAPCENERQGYMAVDPDDPGTVYLSLGNAASAANQGVWKLTGATTGTVEAATITKTEILKPGGGSFTRPTDIAINTGGRAMFIDVGESGASASSAYFTEDGGTTVTDVTNDFFNRSVKKVFGVAMDSSGRVYIAMHGPGVIVGEPQSASTTVSIVQATETELAQPIGRKKVMVVGQATETDIAQAMLGAHVITVGQAIEVDSAQSLLALTINMPVGIATETDIAYPVQVKVSRVMDGWIVWRYQQPRRGARPFRRTYGHRQRG